jgi:hypothetical protein
MAESQTNAKRRSAREWQTLVSKVAERPDLAPPSQTGTVQSTAEKVRGRRARRKSLFPFQERSS